ncbi:MAG: hypothetical protein WC292_06200 [Clostridia bacterium]
MKLEKLNIPVGCDNGVCTHIAKYIVAKEGTPLSMQLKLCEECVKELHTIFGEAVKSAQKRTKK